MLLIVQPTNCKYNTGCWVLCTGYVAGATLRNTWERERGREGRRRGVEGGERGSHCQ